MSSKLNPQSIPELRVEIILVFGEIEPIPKPS